MTTPPVVRLFDRTTPPHIVTLVFVAGISAMNMSIFLPALPVMAEYFDADYAVVQLSVSLYLASTALLQVVIGPISDRYGRRSVLLTSAALFVAATIGCLLSQTIESFLIFRMLQAVIATGIVLSRAIVRDMVPQNQAASMIGYVTMGMALVPMIAPAIGGALTEAFDWRAIFVAVALAGCAIWVLIWFDLGETNTTRSASFIAQFRDYPELLSSRRFWGYVFCAAFASGAFFAYLGGAPYVASEIYGLSSAGSGLVLGFPAIGYAFGNYLTGRNAVRFGVDRLIFFGTVFTLAGLSLSLLLTYAGFDSVYVFFGFCVSVGIGNGLVMPNSSAGMLSVRPQLAGTASGLGGAIMIGGGAALSVMGGLVLSPDSGSAPLQWVMWLTTLAGLFSILFVIARNRVIEADGAT